MNLFLQEIKFGRRTCDQQLWKVLFGYWVWSCLTFDFSCKSIFEHKLVANGYVFLSYGNIMNYDEKEWQILSLIYVFDS